jgi:hypothetical protein
MVKDTLKSLFALVVAGFVALPAPAVQALSITVNPVDEIIENMADAKSVDFSLYLDVSALNNQTVHSVSSHVELNGRTDFAKNSAFDLTFASTHPDGDVQTAGGSMMMIGDTLYFSETGGDWYFIEGSSSAPTESDVDDGVEEIQELMGDLMDRGVISFDSGTPARVNGVSTTRYAYDVDMDRFAEYLVDVDRISEAQADEMRDGLEHTSIRGNVWIDTSEMLPVQFTMYAESFDEGVSDTTVSLTIVFNSFNEPVRLTAPKYAKNLADADFSATEETISESFELTVASMDTDGDGLMNADEETLWHSNPLSNDTDGDGYRDYTEVVNGYDPNGVGKLDSDGDGLTDYAEMTIHWSDRYDADSDNDGYPDGLEIANGYNPNGPGRW